MLKLSKMGDALERSAGGKLQTLLGKLTSNKFAGFLTGLGITAIIQSSSATTVMVVGFVNSGLMNLKQAISVIMGANVGTTVTAWILSLGGIDSDNIFVQLLKPSSFTPILALIGIILYMFCKSNKKKDIGVILLGFAVLMFGMETMTDSVAGLKDNKTFTNLLITFSNPILGVLAGAVLTAIIQSSSASVGILQAFAATGAVTHEVAMPIIMGQNIGTCVTALISSFGTNRNAKRAALVHFSFNIIGTAIWISVFSVIKYCFEPAILGEKASLASIAICHSAFNIACTVVLFPMSSLLEKLAYKLIPESKTPDTVSELDVRLLATPPLALERSHMLANDMAKSALDSIKDSIDCFNSYTEEKLEKLKETEDLTDHYEDIIGSYLVKLSASKLNDNDSTTAAKLLKIIGDLERISDHAVSIAVAAQEMDKKQLKFSKEAMAEIAKLSEATTEIVDLTYTAFVENDIEAATAVQPLEDVIDKLKERMRSNHTVRLQQGACSIELGFVWADILTDMERVSDHCSNIAGCVLESSDVALEVHRSVRALKDNESLYEPKYTAFAEKYL